MDSNCQRVDLVIHCFGYLENHKSKIEISHEGWQRKSSVKRSGTEIEANDLTRSFYEGTCPNKKKYALST